MARKIVHGSLRMRNEKSRQCLDFNKKLLYGVGFWRKTITSKRRPLRNLIFFIPRAFLLLQISLLTANLIDTYIVKSNMDYITDNLGASVIHTLAIIKVITLTNNAQEVKSLMHDLEKMKDGEQYSDRTQRKLFIKHRLLSKVLTLAFMTTCLGTGVNFVFVPLLDVKPTDPSENLLPLPQRGYFPFNTSDPINYEAVKISMYLTAVYNGLCIGTFDTLFVSMMINTIGQLKILQYKLQNIRQIALNKIDSEREKKYASPHHIIEKNKYAGRLDKNYTQPSSTVRPNQAQFKFVPKSQILVPAGYSVPYTRVKPATYNQLFQCNTESSKPTFQHIKVTPRIAVDEVSKGSKDETDNKPSERKTARMYSYREKEIDSIMQKYLGQCVEHHQAIISFVARMEVVFWNALVFQIIASLAVCFVVYQISLAPELNSRVMFLSQIVMGAVAELFMFCWFSSNLTVECYNLNEAMYFSEWRDASYEFKRAMQVVMCRTEQPTEFTIAGLVPLSLVVFRRVVKQSYSMFTLITGLDNGAALIQQ